MAPINKSGRVSPNTIFSEKTEHIGSRYRQETVSEFDVKNRITDLEQQLADLGELQATTQDPDVAKKMSNVERTLEAARSRQTQLKLSRGIIMTRGLESLTSEMMSSQGIEREAVFAAGEDPNMVGAQGLAMTRATSPGESQISVKQRLIREQQSLRGQMKQNATEYESVAKKYIETTDPQKIKEFAAEKTNILERRRGLASRLAATESGLSYIGADEKTLMGVQTSAIREVQRRKEMEEIQRDPVLSKLSATDLRKREINLQEDVAQKTEKVGAVKLKHDDLAASNKDASEAAKELAQALEELKTSTVELQKTQQAIEAGGDDRKLRLAPMFTGAGQMLQSVGQIGLTAAQVYRTATIEAPNLTTSNRIMAARMSNQLYAERKSALSGDMSALTLLDSPAFKMADESATQHEKDMKRSSYAKIASYGAMGLGAALVGTGAVLSATGVGAVGGVPLAGLGGKLMLGGMIAGTAAATVGSFGAATQEGYMAEPQAVNEKLSERQRQIELARQLTSVTGQQRQTAYNFFRGNADTAGALGVSGGRAFLSETSGTGADANLTRMQAFGIGSQQFNELSAFGAAEMGSTFSTNQVFGARNLERAGLGTMQENMQRQALMAQAGANNPQASYASVLETAMSKGLDSSKVLNMISQSTAQTAMASQGFQTMGLDVTGAAAKELTSMVAPDAINKEAETQRAMSTREKMERIATDTNMSFTGMMNVGRIQKFTGLDYEQAVIAGQKDSATLATLSEQAKSAKTDAEKKAAAESMIRAGLSGLVNEKTDQVDLEKLGALERAKTIQKLQMGDIGVATGLTSRKDFQQFAQELDKTGGDGNEILKQDKFKDLRKEMYKKAALAHIDLEQALRGVKGPDANSTLSPADQATVDAAKPGAAPIDISKLSPEQQRAEKLRTSEGKQQVQEIQQASEAMKGFGNLMSAITTATEELQKKGTESNEKFAKAAAKAATDFSQSSEVFTTGLNSLGKVLTEAAENIKAGKWPDDKSGKR